MLQPPPKTRSRRRSSVDASAAAKVAQEEYAKQQGAAAPPSPAPAQPVEDLLGLVFDAPPQAQQQQHQQQHQQQDLKRSLSPFEELEQAMGTAPAPLAMPSHTFHDFTADQPAAGAREAKRQERAPGPSGSDSDSDSDSSSSESSGSDSSGGGQGADGPSATPRHLQFARQLHQSRRQLESRMKDQGRPSSPPKSHGSRHKARRQKEHGERQRAHRRALAPPSPGSGHRRARSAAASDDDGEGEARAWATFGEPETKKVSPAVAAVQAQARPRAGSLPSANSRRAPGAKPPPPPGPPPQKRLVDALRQMREGTAFLKYGKRGYPHFRQFRLTNGNQTLQWYSQSKHLSKTRLDLLDCERVVIGQKTPNFSRVAGSEDLAEASFSLIHSGGTLDLVAKDMAEFQVWTEGLRMLLDEVRKVDRDVSRMRALMVSVDFGGGASGAAAAGGGETLGVPGLGAMAHHRRASNADKTAGPALRERYDATRKKVKKRLEQYRHDGPLLRASPYAEDLETKAREMNRHSLQCHQNLGDGEYQAAADDLWNLEMDLEAFQAILKSAKHK